MQKIYSILLIFFLTACTHTSYETVEIVGKNQNNATLVRGMGVKGTDGSILTSAHIVRNTSLNYTIAGEKYFIIKNDSTSDRAILSRYESSTGYTSETWQLENMAIGEPIYTIVNRNSKFIRLTGKVLESSGSVIGYDSLGRTMILSGIILTDLVLLPGDSGSPIFNMHGEIVDIVHVR